MDKHREQLASAIETVLTAMVSQHEELLTLLNRKRDALRQGEVGLMSELCSLENHKVQAISELEKKRLELVARLTLLLDPQASAPMPMAELAAKLPEPVRTRLTTLRDHLRQRMAAVREQTSVAKRATESLMRHVQGLVQTVTTATAAVTTYGRRGVNTPVLSGMSTFSLTA